MIHYWLNRHLKDIRARTILDVGPGYNTFAIYAAQFTGAQTITFVDYSREILNWQITECEKANLEARTVQADLNQCAETELPGPFDLILCQEVLEHLPQAGQLLSHLARQLSPEGAMVITVPTGISERFIAWLNPAYMKNEPCGHVNQFGRAELVALLNQAGLRSEVFLPIQPHYFIGHLWLFGSRVRIEGASGTILVHDWRTRVFKWLVRGSRFFFRHTFPRFWGRCFPRNYFIIARHKAEK